MHIRNVYVKLTECKGFYQGLKRRYSGGGVGKKVRSGSFKTPVIPLLY
jgi:hypothetical protein